MLRGRWLLAARVAWLAVAAAALAIVVFSVPALLEHFGELCRGSARSCMETGRLTPEEARAFAEAGLSTGAHAALMVGVDAFSRLAWFAVGAVIFLRRSEDPMALLVAFFLVTFGTATFATDGVEALISSNPAWLIPGRSVQVLGEFGAVMFFLLFPNGRFAPRWTLWIAVAFLAYQIPGYFFPGFYSWLFIPESAQGGVFMGLVLGMVCTQVYRYRNVYSPRQQRKTRWVIAGAALSICTLFGVLAPLWLLPGTWSTAPPFVLYLIGLLVPFLMLPIPLSIGVAVLRSGLFDIDVVINRTLAYGFLTVTLALVYVSSVALLQSAFRAVSAGESDLAVVASTLAIAAIFVPLRRRIQNFIDRIFYRRKYDAKETLAAFSGRLRDETELDTLSGDLVAVVRQTVQPEHVSLWLRPSISRSRGAEEV